MNDNTGPDFERGLSAGASDSQQDPTSAGESSPTDERTTRRGPWWLWPLLGLVVLALILFSVYASGRQDRSTSGNTPSPGTTSTSSPSSASGSGASGSGAGSSGAASTTPSPAGRSASAPSTSTPPTADSTAASPASGSSAVPPASAPLPELPPVDITADSERDGGVVVSLPLFESIAGEAKLPGEVAGAAIRVTIEVRNDSSAPVSLDTVVVNGYSGPDRLPLESLTSPGGRPFAGSVAPGATASAVYLFAVDSSDRSDVTITVDLQAGTPASVFRGDARR